MAIQIISLESLLEPQYSFGDTSSSPEDVLMETMDILEEIHAIEMNLATYEAAAKIRKSKTKSKKVKIKKSKMSAKDAKNKKKNGRKIVKITKENDPDIDGAEGPLPSTSDNQGLTDTDLDEDPSATVNVTEIVDDGTPSEEITGTEGVDYLCIYEDSEIVAFEEESKGLWRKFIDKVKAIWRKIVEFVKSIIRKIVELFKGKKKYVDDHKQEIKDNWYTLGEKNPTIPVKACLKPDFSKKFDAEVDEILKEVKNVETLKMAEDPKTTTVNNDTSDRKALPWPGEPEAKTDNKPLLLLPSPGEEVKFNSIGINSFEEMIGILDDKKLSKCQTLLRAVEATNMKLQAELTKMEKSGGGTPRQKEQMKLSQVIGIHVQKRLSRLISEAMQAANIASAVARVAAAKGDTDAA